MPAKACTTSCGLNLIRLLKSDPSFRPCATSAELQYSVYVPCCGWAECESRESLPVELLDAAERLRLVLFTVEACFCSCEELSRL